MRLILTNNTNVEFLREEKLDKNFVYVEERIPGYNTITAYIPKRYIKKEIKG